MRGVWTAEKSRHDISEARGDTVESTTEAVEKTATSAHRVCY